MGFEAIEWTPLLMLRLGVVVAVLLLLVLLVASFASRAKMFCQYLKHMSGIELRPRMVRAAFRRQGQGGVRDLLINLLIQQDLADQSRIVTPESEPDHSVFESGS